MTTKILSIIFTAAFLIAPAAAQDRDSTVEKENPGANTFVLLIGINKYPPEIPSLKYCVRDTEGLAASLKKVGVPTTRMIVMVDNAEKVTWRPSRENIMRQINTVTSLVTENDQLVVSFSGHGAQIDGEAYLCPNDTNLESINSFLSRKWIYEKLERCPAKRKLFITDCCRNEVMVAGAKSIAGVKSLADPLGDKDSRGFALLTSCSKDQKSYEDESLKHGVFTYFVMKGLEGEAANEKGVVTFNGLYDYVLNHTREHVHQTRDTAQVPMRGGEFSGDFVLAVNMTLPVVTPKPKPTTTTTKPPVSTVSGSSGTNAGDRKVITVKGVSYAFRWCPAGKFTMGSPESEFGNDYPTLEKQHQVTLTKGFWMLETQVTQEMWESVTGKNPSNFKDSKKLPVEMVSWNDCQDYIKKLNALKAAPAGYRFSLPTEAQWEYACRAGKTTGLNNGKNLTSEEGTCPNLSEVGWYDKNSDSKTHEVGLKKPNAWGLCDMHGNVWEWCLDWWAPYPDGSVTAPTGPTTASDRVLRGGSWGYNAGWCRSAFRYGSDPSFQSSFYSLRLALVRD